MIKTSKEEIEVLTRIRHHIKERGCSQKYIAERAGLKQQAMNDILSGRKQLRIECLCKIAGALEVTAGLLLGEHDICVGANQYREIQVLTNEGELIASIAAEGVIEKYGYKAVCIR